MSVGVVGRSGCSLALPTRLPPSPADPLIEVTDPFLAQLLGVRAFARTDRRRLARYVQWAVWERKGWLLQVVTADELRELWPTLTLSSAEADALADLVAGRQR